MTDKEVLLLRRKLDLLLRTGKLLMEKRRRHESYRAKHETSCRLYGDPRGEVAYRYPVDHDHGKRKR